MHELGIAGSICRSIVARVGTSRVEELVIGVGPLAGVTPVLLHDALPHSFEHAGLVVEKYSVEPSPAQAACECGHNFELTDLFAPCPKCGSVERVLTGASDVVVKKLIVSE